MIDESISTPSINRSENMTLGNLSSGSGNSNKGVTKPPVGFIDHER